MNPSELMNTRKKCLEWFRMPSLAFMLTLEQQKKQRSADLVSFMSGLLLGSDPQIRSWISFFVRNGQKKRNPALAAYRYSISYSYILKALRTFISNFFSRAALLERLRELVNSMKAAKHQRKVVNVDLVVKASTLLRLYTALRGIAGMK